ncbi:MAG: ThuA domain-containing protein, partial [Oscillospiraceae bacterium]|nr:ThuA domain-containing protein [Oscillospiraceae bacterium]
IWVIEPSHPIAKGLNEYIEIPNEEMYGERFDIPAPDSLVFVSWFEGGEVFRSGCCFIRGNGRIFYFRPGHESFPVYYHEGVLKVIENACRWAYAEHNACTVTGNVKPLEDIGDGKTTINPDLHKK